MNRRGHERRPQHAGPANAMGGAMGAMGAMGEALRRALAGDDTPLFALLTRESRLPGPRANDALAAAFAKECASRGVMADALAVRMATLDPDRAPGASALEFLPVCGVLALGARGAADVKVRARCVAVLHDAAEDLRWRVRDAVPEALARIGASAGDALVVEVESWIDGYFQAAAVLRALARAPWTSALREGGAALARLDEAFALARDADRAAARYPGYKALLDALALAPGVLAARFGPAVFDLLVRWAEVKDPALREAVEQNLHGGPLAKRYASEIARVRAALSATAPTRRDPRTDVGPTRARGRKRAR